MKLYTKTGDEGKTSVIGGRLNKSHIRVKAYGSLDELNSFVGLTITKLYDPSLKDIASEMVKIQHELFDCGGDLSAVKADYPFKTKEEIVFFLEERIDLYVQEAPELERFILPGGSELAALFHICRTIARRAEREIVELKQTDTIHPEVLRYVNRLSDYFFAAARVVNHRLKIKDVEYERSAIVFKGGKRKGNDQDEK
ncbi:cob(I)yrinic acid a,c-diamide adenosyltransferase [Fictibacillus nanhaiensis]|jgi:cob(I)alamin adenosyltransferase|uniref:cob(I)yrinic acid a,c-diamide adenosyltransferase n=1 Tax=Fictibacillus nanhaiensis TaxID=742169 RepID=UPI002040EC28|nr:cob(I)yrinic acid a,c-diamide adenosyltransferase [Fictibacillus nanhaiensis]MCM3731413.1 cob(I)yrinic acid a,c-diamide adenosyltransferase [Fictibacillus nanhaiensis]